MAPLIAAPGLAFTLGVAGIWLLRRATPALPRAVPNARSLHAFPVPRAGGYAIWLGFLPAAIAFAPAFPWGLAGWLPPSIALIVVSGRDDAKEVGVAARLTVHGIAALWTATALVSVPDIASGMDWMRSLFVAACVALVIAWSANLYNFMDGIDGLAGTMGAMGFAAYAVASACGVQASPAGIRSAPAFAALAAAMLPFLAVNLPPARMFLGDVGAVPLGYLAAAFGAAGVGEKLWAPWFPVLVFLPFVADASLTLARRIARGERLWEGHRGHYYQRLAQLCAGHAGALGVYACVMGGTALTAVLCHASAPRAGWWALAAWCVVLIMMFAAIDYHWHKKTGIPSPR